MKASILATTLCAVALSFSARAAGFDPPVISTTAPGSPIVHADGIQSGARVNQLAPVGLGGGGGAGGAGGGGGQGFGGGGGQGFGGSGGLGQGGNASAGNASVNFTGTNYRAAANTAYAPSNYSNNICAGKGWSAGGMGIPGGGAIGYQGMDDACRLGRVGMQDAAIELLCNDPDMHKAMVHTGHGCFADLPEQEQKKILQRARYGYADGDVVQGIPAVTTPAQPDLGNYCASLKGYVGSIRRKHPECSPFLAASR